MKKLIALLALSVSFIFSCEAKDFKYTLSIAAIFQNEAPYLKEWIEYHKLAGVEHFYLYNNSSSDNYLEVLAPYIEQGLVELTFWPSPESDKPFHTFCFSVQPGAYMDAVTKSRNISKWLALIDTDEFLFSVLDEDVAKCLEKRFPGVSGLNVNWQCYGTSHVKKIDPCLPMIGQLVMKMPRDHYFNKNCKSIVQPLHVASCNNPHFCYFLGQHFGVDTKFRPCEGISETVEVDVIRINHYWTRDEWYFENCKLARYNKWGADSTHITEFSSEMNSEYDFNMEDYAERLQRLNE